eukprot:PLAT12311.1.p1 GENE.PLAT12311.1~~PLAT12311.1.p1  ORF type:complete len:176 (+),score=23.49 PLAT12311.1:65-592(+)
MDAPIEVPARRPPPEGKEAEPVYAWYRASDDGSEYIGWEDCVKALTATFDEAGPFDGVLGFSQGAIVSSVLAAMSAAKTSDAAGLSVKFAICFSGFKPRLPELTSLYETAIDVPSLHIWGTSDEVVTADKSELLSKAFVDSVTWQHEGGHYVPTTAEACRAYRTFLEGQAERLLS